jgi:Ribonuclease G/E
MRGTVIVLDHVEGREVAALIRDGRLDDLLVELAQMPPLPGTVYRAVVDRALKGQGALLLRLPDGESAFLREAAGLRPGQTALVQATSHVEPGKAVPVSAKVLFKSRYAIVTPDAPGLNVSRRLKDEARRVELLDLAHAAMAGSTMGLILRSEAETGPDEAISQDIALMRDLAEKIVAESSGQGPALLLDGPGPHQMAFRDWPAPDLLDDKPGSLARHGVGDLIDALRGPHVALGGGAHAYIEPTRALVAIDVNTGGDGSLAAGLKANLALARELPRQLRLRGLGGQVTLDLAPMPKKDRLVFEGHLRAAFRLDPVETALAGWTPLGHFELQRKRERLPIPAEALP